jgi:hypothetical protein
MDYNRRIRGYAQSMENPALHKHTRHDINCLGPNYSAIYRGVVNISETT